MDLIQNLIERLKFDHPTDEQLEAMNRFKPAGQADYSRNEMLSVPILASNNFVRHDLTVWTERALTSMAATYPGEVLMLNHDWGDVKESVGFVYDCELIRIPAGGMMAKERLLGQSINADIDGELYDKQGFLAVVCYGAVPADSPFAGVIRNRLVADVSTGGTFLNGSKYICPLCGGDFGKNDEHWPPGGYTQMLVQMGELDPALVAPFAWREGYHKSIELSFVTEGNVPGATIFTEDLIKLIAC